MRIRGLTVIAAGVVLAVLQLGQVTQVYSDSQNEQLTLSQTFSLMWPKSLHAKLVHLPSFRGFWLEGNYDGKPYAIWTRRQDPPTLANTASVKRLWQENLKASTGTGDQNQDLGCRQIEGHAYRCDALVRTKSGEFVAQALFWNSRSDLAAVRVKSKHSREDAVTILGQLKFQIFERAPAGTSSHAKELAK